MQDVLDFRLDALFAVRAHVLDREKLEHGMQTLAVYQGAGSLFAGKEGGEEILRLIGGEAADLAAKQQATPQPGRPTPNAKPSWGDDGDKLAAVGKRMGNRARKG